MYSDLRLNLYQSGRIDEWLRLGVDSVAGKCVLDGCNGLSLLGNLFRFVELDVALQHSWFAVRIFLALLVLLQLGVLLLIWRADHAPATAPRSACPEAYSDPILIFGVLSRKDHADVVQEFALSSNQRPSVGLLQRRVFVHGEPNGCRPLRQSVVGIKVEQILVLCSC